MLREFYTAALGMLPQQTRLETIANNLANANTIGYKRKEVFERNLIDAKSVFFNVQEDVERNDPPIGSYIDFSPGAYRKTGSKLDFALGGKNLFFSYLDDQGAEVYSKAASLKLDSDGFLVSPDGKKILGENGPINLSEFFPTSSDSLNDERNLEISVSKKGEIFADGKEIGKLKIVKVQDLNVLENLSNSDFFSTVPEVVEEANRSEIDVRQGWLESSNVNPVQEMIKMIELTRQFEAGSKTITINDDTLNYSLQIGRFY